MADALQAIGAKRIIQDYERDPVVITLLSQNATLTKERDALKTRAETLENRIYKHFDVNFKAAIKDACNYVKKDPDLSRRLIESLKTQNTPNTKALLKIFLDETEGAEDFGVFGGPLPPVKETEVDKLREDILYYQKEMKSTEINPQTELRIQEILERPGTDFLKPDPEGPGAGYYAWATLEFIGNASYLTYKHGLKVGTFALAATPLVLFLLLIKEINKLTSGKAFQMIASGAGYIAWGAGKLFK